MKPTHFRDTPFLVTHHILLLPYETLNSLEVSKPHYVTVFRRVLSPFVEHVRYLIVRICVVARSEVPAYHEFALIRCCCLCHIRKASMECQGHSEPDGTS